MKKVKQPAVTWRRLDPDKISAGVAIVAAALGQEVTSPRKARSEADLECALAPYCAFAAFTLYCGAFDYEIKKNPTNRELIDVAVDFLRAVGEATAGDEIRLRTGLINIQKGRLATQINKKIGSRK